MTLLTTSQVAEQLGIQRRQVSRLCAAGTIRATKAGRDYLIDRADLPAASKRPKPGRRWPKSDPAS